MMTTILLVGVGSYVLRVVPLLLVNRLKLSARTQELLELATLATIAALLVTMVLHFAEGPPLNGPPAAPWIALGAGALAAAFRQSMARVLLIGMAVYLSLALLPTILS